MEEATKAASSPPSSSPKASSAVNHEDLTTTNHNWQLQQENRQEYLFKILVIGDIGSGKTSIIKRYVHNFYSPHYRATIGVDFAMKVLNWDDGSIIRLQLWDIAGQERFGNMTRVYYKEASGAFIVFDVTRPATFDAVIRWKADLDAKVRLADGRPIPCLLLANKSDLEKSGFGNYNQKPEDMDEYCQRHGFVGWADTSAKENTGIDEAAGHLVQNVLAVQRAGQYEIPVIQRDNDTWRITGGDNNNQRTTSSNTNKCCF